MAGTTFTQAIKARYETIVTPGWPAFWSGIIPEGQATDPGFPNHVFIHMGERPERFQQDQGVGFKIALLAARCRMCFYDVGEANAETLAEMLQPVMEDTPLEIHNDVGVYLFREDYRLMPTKRRGPAGQFVFEASTYYLARFDPSGE